MPILLPEAKGELERNESSHAGFVFGLCWSHPISTAAHQISGGFSSIRLLEFPSWSWTGWNGMIESHPSPKSPSGDYWEAYKDVKIGVELIDGKVVDWDEFEKNDHRSNNSDALPASLYLLVDAWTVPVKLQYTAAHHPPGLYALVGLGLGALYFRLQSPIGRRKPTAAEKKHMEGQNYT